VAAVTTVNDLLDGHVALNVECLDRIYLNGYVPNLQVGGQVVSFMREHLGVPIPSPAVLEMHEEWVHTNNNTRSITVGQAETGGIITAAAMIMIAVFGGFVLGDLRAIKLFGIGLASAVFLDAFVLRTVLVPSLMHLLGKANWYFPKSLDKITPHVSIAAEDAAEARAPAPQPRGDEDELARV
jgi:uncharacterized membrane protein YdfJ with MMPL/SSD domain